MITLNVPKIHCDKCKASVEAALKPIDGTRYVRVDVAARKVEVGGSVAPDTLVAALSRIGFEAEVVA
jgi:copper chaperone CopZ